MPEPDPAEPPAAEITLEEWIAAGQSCCGADHEPPTKPDDPPAPDRSPGERGA